MAERTRVYKCVNPTCEHYNVHTLVEPVVFGSPTKILHSWPADVHCAECDRPAWRVTPEAPDPSLNWYWEET